MPLLRIGLPGSRSPSLHLRRYQVVLAAFAAKAAGTAVDVTWRTASERNNSHFVVERAAQGKDSFIALGRVEGSGTSGARSYSFRDDKAAATQASTLYYRLRQVDLDGTQTYSPVVAVLILGAKLSAFDVYLNSASNIGDVKIELPNLDLAEGATGLLKIYDMRGILLRQLPATQQLVTLPVEALSAGLYNIVLLGSYGQQLGSKRLVLTGR